MSYGAFPKYTRDPVSVTTTPAQLIGANEKRYVLFIVNEGPSKVYLGSGSMTSGSGLPLPSGSIYPDYDSKDSWWAATASGTADVRLMEVEHE